MKIETYHYEYFKVKQSFLDKINSLTYAEMTIDNNCTHFQDLCCNYITREIFVNRQPIMVYDMDGNLKRKFNIIHSNCRNIAIDIFSNILYTLSNDCLNAYRCSDGSLITCQPISDDINPVYYYVDLKYNIHSKLLYIMSNSTIIATITPFGS